MLAIVFALLAAARAEVVDEILVVVGDRGDQLVTTSDIALEVELAQIDRSPSPFWDSGHADARDRLVDAAILRVAAGDVALYQPNDEQVRARVATLRLHFSDDVDWANFLARWGLDETAVTVLVRRRLVVERYLARNMTANPADPTAWFEELHADLARLRDRVVVREIQAAP